MAEGNIQYLNVPGKAAREAKHDEEPDPVSRNRPVEFTLALVEMICDRITSGERLSRICAEKDMPKRANRRGWPVAARLEAGVALMFGEPGSGSQSGAGCLVKRGRAEGHKPEAGPRVAEAGWHQAADFGPCGQR